MKNIILAISGPSGVGKGTLVNKLLKDRTDLVPSVSCTTRAPREGEVNGREYFFLTHDEFKKRIDENDFLEYDEHFGNFYGTPKSFVLETLKEKSVILEIDVCGVLNAKKQLPEAVTVFVAPPSKEELVARLRGRGSETEESIEKRVSRMEYEFSFKGNYEYVIVNDDLERAYKELVSVIEKEKNKQ